MKLRMWGLAVALIVFAGAAQAQWVFVARKALGKVQEITQQAPSARVDTVIVILDVPADKVYAAIRRRVAANPGLTTTRVNEARRFVEYTDGQLTGAMQVAELGDAVSQLVVSTIAPRDATAMPSIVERVLTVCEEVGVKCSQASP